MESTPPFMSSAARDAWATIRGFVYQVDQTIERWVNLQRNQVLQLERGEDIDIVEPLSTALTHPEKPEQKRLLEQIKHRDYNITLKSPEAVTSIINFLAHREANPKTQLFFRFTTNSATGIERPPATLERVPGIDIWEDIRCGRTQAEKRDDLIEALRKVMIVASRPSDIADIDWQRFDDFRTNASIESFMNLIQRFEWSTGSLDAESISDQVQQLLLEKELAPNRDKLTAIYQHLFLFVFKTLSKAGIKQLSFEQLLEQLATPHLTDSDELLRTHVVARLSQIGGLANVLGIHVRENREAIKGLQSQLEEVARRQELDLAIVHTISSPAITAPRPLQQQVPRTTTVSSLVDRIAATTWLCLTGGIGTGKSELALLCTYAVSHKRCFWIRFRQQSVADACLRLDAAIATISKSGQTCAPQHYDSALARVGLEFLFVCDDAPIDDISDLTDRMVVLAASVDRHGGKLISTSYRPPPRRVRDELGATLDVVSAPPFRLEECSELFAAYGLGDTDRPNLINTALSLSQGNPTILTAMARYLAAKDWRFSSDEFWGLFRQDYSGELLDDTVRHLVRTVQDEGSRGLLYRLNIILEPISWNHVTAVSSAPPVIERPRERMNALLGLWVQQHGDNEMEVSPLAKLCGDADVAEETKRVALPVGRGRPR